MRSMLTKAARSLAVVALAVVGGALATTSAAVAATTHGVKPAVAQVVVEPIANQYWVNGDDVSLLVHAKDSEGLRVTWSEVGLECGLGIRSDGPDTGLISGIVECPATTTMDVTVKATDTEGAHGSASFTAFVFVCNGEAAVCCPPGDLVCCPPPSCPPAAHDLAATVTRNAPAVRRQDAGVSAVRL